MHRDGEELTVGGVLQAAFALYRNHAATLFKIVALVVIPAQVLVLIIFRVSLSHAFAINGTIYTSGPTAVPALSVIVIGFISAILAIGALSKALVDAYTGHPSDWRHSLSFAGDHLGPLIWLALVSGILLTIGYLLLVIPGIYFTVAWSVAVPALVFERIGPLAALQRSQDLVAGRWWATFAALLVALVLIVGLTFVIDLILGAIASSGTVDVLLLVSAIARTISALLTYPLLAAVSAVIYVDLRARKEGPTGGGLAAPIGTSPRR